MERELWKKRRKRTHALLTVVILVALNIQRSEQTEEVYQANCRSSLGMHSGSIPDHAITASSSYDYKSVGPHNSRIRKEENGGAWCPKEMVSRDVYEFLEIDLGGLKVITLVETQGRFGNGQGQEFAEYYLLEYQRANHGTWIRYKDKHGTELFRGNLNTYIAELREVNPPVIARRVRIVPYSRHHRTVCMRVELYGCPWKEGLVSYNMHQGDRRGSGVNLYDFTYDGKIQDGFLSGGLGQLVDGEEGLTNFRLDPQGTGKKGYEWIGWKNESQAAPPVEIRFEFDQVRNFSSMRVHCNNLFTKDVRVFRMAKMYFSVGGLYYTSPPIVYQYMKDTLIEYARAVIIPLHHRVGKYVKMELYFDARWIMMSEIKFESDPVMYEVPAEAPPPSMFPATKSPPVDTDAKNKEKEHPMMEVRVIKQEKRPLGTKPKDSSSVLTTVSSHPTEATGGAVVKPESQKDKKFKEEHIGIIIGVISALILLLFAVAVFIILRRRREKEAITNHGFMFEKHKLPCDVNDLKTLPPKVPNYDMYNSMAVSDTEEDSFTKLKGTPRVEESSGECSGLLCQTSHANTEDGQNAGDPSDMNGEALFVKLPPEPVFHSNSVPSNRSSRASSQPPHLCNPPTVPPPPIPPPPNPTALLEVNNDHSSVHVDGSGNTSGIRASPRSSPATAMMDRKTALMEFPRDSLQVVDRLGQGQFGEVELCQVCGGPADWLVGVNVVVKVLRPDADSVAREHFHREAEILAGLRDPNLAQVLGFCTKTEPMCMVLEFAGLGDLNNFLNHRIPEDADISGQGRTISYGAQIYMATQIASGMKYLESLNMVHRDLATRNVLVGEHYAIKISDLGMSRDIYTRDYFCIEGRAMLPIRWMAWECVLLGKFSNKSDVWSFAVTLWEILGFAREQPFFELTDEQVIENCGHYFKQDGQEAYLPQPDICPKEIYDLMHECWNRDELQRPAFREIHMFLQRKNMGYNPVEDAKRSGDVASCGAI